MLRLVSHTNSKHDKTGTKALFRKNIVLFLLSVCFLTSILNLFTWLIKERKQKRADVMPETFADHVDIFQKVSETKNKHTYGNAKNNEMTIAKFEMCTLSKSWARTQASSSLF